MSGFDFRHFTGKQKKSKSTRRQKAKSRRTHQNKYEKEAFHGTNAIHGIRRSRGG